MRTILLCAAAAAVLGGCSAPPRQAGVDPAILASVDPGTAKQSRTDLEAADRPWYANVWDGVDKADAAADQ